MDEFKEIDKLYNENIKEIKKEVDIFLLKKYGIKYKDLKEVE